MSDFYAASIMVDPRFNSTKTIADSSLLEPVMRQKVAAIIDAAGAQGLSLMVFETFRSRARQEELFNAGASQLKKVGVHHYGLACDLVRSVNGQPSWKGDFSLLGALAREHGLIWGGDWGKPGQPNHFVDAVHVQRCAVGRQQQLFARAWYPDDAYDPYTDPLL